MIQNPIQLPLSFPIHNNNNFPSNTTPTNQQQQQQQQQPNTPPIFYYHQQSQQQFNQNQQYYHNQQQPLSHQFSSLFDCIQDEESCWWTTWCCWIVGSRTKHSFGLGNSINDNLLFWFVIFGMLFTFKFLPKIFLLFTFISWMVLLIQRVRLRYEIRRHQQIEGDICSDIAVHCCCLLCAVCQESRELKKSNLVVLDYCFGENLTWSEDVHGREVQIISSPQGPDLTNSSDNSVNDTELLFLSKTSKLIICISCIIAFLSFILLFKVDKSQNILILLLVFVQPLGILYFIYWKHLRQHVYLDFVVKLFAIGFWFTTFQSVILEIILQLVIGILMSPFMIDPNEPHPTDNTNSNSNVNIVQSDISTHISNKIGGALIQVASNIIGFGNYLEVSSSYNDLNGHLFSAVAPIDLSSYDSSRYLSSTNSSSTEESTDDKRMFMKSHLFPIIIALILMSYVVAAGVEETMKHFIVKCCHFPKSLRNPNTILVYLMAGALGFATCENIEYVFGTTSSPIKGTSLFVGEILVLLIRVCMPIHVICSVLQASYLSKSLMNTGKTSLFMILLPAIFLHGTFDFVLFLSGTLEFIYDISGQGYGTLLEIITFFISILITIGGIIWAYKSFKNVQNKYTNGYATPIENDIDNVNVNNVL